MITWIQIVLSVNGFYSNNNKIAMKWVYESARIHRHTTTQTHTLRHLLLSAAGNVQANCVRCVLIRFHLDSSEYASAHTHFKQNQPNLNAFDSGFELTETVFVIFSSFLLKSFESNWSNLNGFLTEYAFLAHLNGKSNGERPLGKKMKLCGNWTHSELG